MALHVVISFEIPAWSRCEVPVDGGRLNARVQGIAPPPPGNPTLAGCVPIGKASSLDFFDRNFPSPTPWPTYAFRGAGVHGVTMSLGSISNIEGRMTQGLAASHQEAMASVAESTTKHLDEATWRESNKFAWVWAGVALARKRRQSGKEWVQILGLLVGHTLKSVRQAIELSLERGAIGLTGVKQLLRHGNQPRLAIEPVDINEPDLVAYEIPPADLSR